ncbi:MAG: family 43 glycosylhydrolase [Firmicutes bacterium]|nr:family 43 glycosylhydrolase [Bacillota bacterium]
MSKKPHIIDESAGLTTLRDPMIMVVGDTYYLTGTQAPYWEGPNAGVHMWSTKDMVHFTDLGNVIRREDLPEEFWGRDRFWAPELFDGHDGWYYLTFNARNDSEEYPHFHAVGLARAKHPEGPYEILSKEKSVSEEFGSGNDANLFRDEDGTLYIAFNANRTMYIHKLDPENTSISDPVRVCGIGAEGEWDAIGVEGACIVKRHDIYFYWYSSWTYGYNSGLLTATSMQGPWTKHPDNPFLNANDVWHLCGHNHTFTGLDGKDYIIFHANLREPDGDDVERIFIRRVEYLPDGSAKILEDKGFGE